MKVICLYEACAIFWMKYIFKEYFSWSTPVVKINVYMYVCAYIIFVNSSSVSSWYCFNSVFACSLACFLCIGACANMCSHGVSLWNWKFILFWFLNVFYPFWVLKSWSFNWFHLKTSRAAKQRNIHVQRCHCILAMLMNIS